METVVGLPHDFKQGCKFIINDKHWNVVARNAITFLLAFVFPNGEASELIVHFWYSASLSSRMWRGITEKVTPLISDIVKENKEKTDSAVLTKHWKFGTSSISLTIKTKEWEMLLEMINPKSPLNLASTEAHARTANIGNAATTSGQFSVFLALYALLRHGF